MLFSAPVASADQELDDLQNQYNDLQKKIEKNQKELNKLMPNYMAISKIELQEEEFVKTPKKSIKRYLYN